MIQLDHIQILAHNPLESARRLAEILGTAHPVPEGADDDMFRIDFDHGAFILFAQAKEIHSEHMAFRVDLNRFKEIVKRLKSKKIAFGNQHEDLNGETSDPLGGVGRVYFFDGNGHLFEVVC